MYRMIWRGKRCNRASAGPEALGRAQRGVDKFKKQIENEPGSIQLLPRRRSHTKSSGGASATGPVRQDTSQRSQTSQHRPARLRQRRLRQRLVKRLLSTCARNQSKIQYLRCRARFLSRIVRFLGTTFLFRCQCVIKP